VTFRNARSNDANDKVLGGPELLAELEKTKLASNVSAAAGISDMKLLFSYLDVFGITSKVRLFGLPSFGAG
jgi:hypothetical protein